MMAGVAQTLRTADWRPLGGFAILSLVLGAVVQPSDSVDTRTPAIVMRVCALALGTGMAWLIRDRMLGICEVAVVRRSRRWAILMVAGLTLSAAAWFVTLLLVMRALPSNVGFVGLAIEAATLTGILVLFTTVRAERSDLDEPALWAAGVLVGLIIMTLPIRDQVWPNPSELSWDQVHVYWSGAGLIVIGLCAVLVRRL